MQKGSRLLTYINARLRVTIQQDRVMEGTFMAFDRHMNIVLGDAEEYRTVRVKKAGGGMEDKEEKRALGLVLVRGANVVSVQVVKAAASMRQAAGAAGSGAARAVGRGTLAAAAAAGGGGGGGAAGAPHGLAGAPMRGLGGPAPAMMAPPPGFMMPGMMGMPPQGYYPPPPPGR